MVLAEDLPAPLADARTLAAVLANARDVRHELVAAHPDSAAHPVVGDIDTRLVEGIDPGLGVGVVAVHERAVDVEDDR